MSSYLIKCKMISLLGRFWEVLLKYLRCTLPVSYYIVTSTSTIALELLELKYAMEEQMTTEIKGIRIRDAKQWKASGQNLSHT